MDQPVILTDDDLWGAPPPSEDRAGAVTETSPEAPAAGAHPSRKWIAALAGTVVVGVAALVGANLASTGTQNLGVAGPGGNAGGPGGAGGFGGRGAGNAGTIASIDGSSLKMTTMAGTTVNVKTSAATTVSISSTGQLTDVRVGDNVRVGGTTSGTTVAATSITDSGTSPLADGPGGGFGGPPPAGGNGNIPPAAGARPQDGRGAGGPGPAGVVKSVTGSTFTVATTDGTTLTVDTTSATTVTVVKPASLSVLRVGDTIQVTGAPSSDDTITATAIRSGAVPGGR